MPTSVGPVVDATIVLCQTACPAAQVVDGYPLADEGGLFIGVGGLIQPDEDGQQMPNQIGGFQLREEYDLSIVINYTTGDTNQKLMRDAVLVAYDAIVTEWRTEMIARTGLAAACELSWPSGFSLAQTNRDTLSEGRPWFAEMFMTLHIVNHNT
jgi:hypothetical protein